MPPTAQFTKSVAANINYWRQLTAELDDDMMTALVHERHNLFRAAEFGLGLADTWRDTADLIVQAFPLIRRFGDWREWIPILEKSVRQCSEDDLAVKGQALNQLGILYRIDRRFDTALTAHEQEEAVGHLLGEERRLAFSQLRYAETYWRLRRYDEAEAHAEAALASFTSIGADSEHIAACLNILGNIALGRGDLTTAAHNFRESLELYRQVEQPLNLAQVLNNLGRTLQQAGEMDGALASYREAKELLPPEKYAQDAVNVELNIGTFHFNQGNLVGAEEAFGRAYSIQRRHWVPTYYRAMTTMNLANIRLVQGRLDEAEANWRECIEGWRESDAHLMLANSLGGLAETLAAKGATDQAIPLFDEALAILAEYPNAAWAKRLNKLFKQEREDTILAVKDIGHPKPASDGR